MGNTQMLDGGAMFGNAPKALWQRWVKPDAENRIPLACRAFLFEFEGRSILMEAGIGTFFEPKLRSRYGIVESEHKLLDSLQRLGLTHTDIDCVILSHLHFDHAGGLLSSYVQGEEPQLLFPNAEYIVSEAAWQRALEPHSRDRASYVPVLNRALADSSRLKLVARQEDAVEIFGEAFSFHFSEGHTPGQLHLEIPTLKGPLVFAGDLIPGQAWMHIPITMGYDRFPERVIDEKKAMLESLFVRGGRLLFTHDPNVACVRVCRDDHGRYFGEPSDLV